MRSSGKLERVAGAAPRGSPPWIAAGAQCAGVIMLAMHPRTQADPEMNHGEG
jgi:hypothetical protein